MEHSHLPGGLAAIALLPTRPEARAPHPQPGEGTPPSTTYTEKSGTWGLLFDLCS